MRAGRATWQRGEAPQVRDVGAETHAGRSAVSRALGCPEPQPLPAEANAVPTRGGDPPTLTRGQMQMPAPSQRWRLPWRAKESNGCVFILEGSENLKRSAQAATSTSCRDGDTPSCHRSLGGNCHGRREPWVLFFLAPPAGPKEGAPFVPPHLEQPASSTSTSRRGRRANTT